MPHHWKPIDPSSPSEDEKVGKLVVKLGKRLKYVGRASEEDRVWALLDVTDAELQELASAGLVTLGDPAEKRLEP
jgi:hypothetical protein